MRELEKRVRALEAKRTPKCSCGWNVYWIDDPDAPNAKPPSWVRPCPLHGVTTVSWRGSAQAELEMN